MLPALFSMRLMADFFVDRRSATCSLSEAGFFPRLAEKSADLEIGVARFETLGELRIASGACLGVFSEVAHSLFSCSGSPGGALRSRSLTVRATWPSAGRIPPRKGCAPPRRPPGHGRSSGSRRCGTGYLRGRRPRGDFPGCAALLLWRRSSSPPVAGFQAHHFSFPPAPAFPLPGANLPCG